MFKTLLRIVLKALFRVELTGDPTTFINARTLIVANHESFIDGLLIGLMMPVDAVFVVHTQIASRPLLGFILRFIPHLAVDSTSPLAMKQIVKLVETGKPVVIVLLASKPLVLPPSAEQAAAVVWAANPGMKLPIKMPARSAMINPASPVSPMAHFRLNFASWLGVAAMVA